MKFEKEMVNMTASELMEFIKKNVQILDDEDDCYKIKEISTSLTGKTDDISTYVLIEAENKNVIKNDGFTKTYFNRLKSYMVDTCNLKVRERLLKVFINVYFDREEIYITTKALKEMEKIVKNFFYDR